MENETMTEVTRQTFKNGDKRNDLKEILSSYVHVEEIETRSHIGLEIHVEGEMKHQTGTVRDLLSGQCDHWQIRNIVPQGKEMWAFEAIYVE